MLMKFCLIFIKLASE